MRKTEFANEEFYHVFNRGVDKREVFLNDKDFQRFLLSMNLLNDETDGLMIAWRDYKKANPDANIDNFLKLGFRKRDRLVDIVAYCLNPNHYHFILRQLKNRGVEKFMHKVGVSHTKYFNKKNKRNGPLFQGKFKAVHIDSNEYLLYLSAYVNNNNFIHGYNKFNSWAYSSLRAYLGKENCALAKKDVVLGQFKDVGEYENFLEKNALYMRDKKELERYLIEDQSS